MNRRSYYMQRRAKWAKNPVPGTPRHGPKQRARRATWLIRKMVEGYPGNGLTTEELWGKVMELIWEETRAQHRSTRNKLVLPDEEREMKAAFKRWEEDDRRNRE